ncbi:AfsR/SARP family transcriptional regulator [Streptomyces paludis]|uniref:AfsR family transcriptional regulator n=1 Tax=Streptomyces paludis TaxID=2282738 RepID=A0A345HLD9_9ACTN|nr:BTAD domain-containing putative transcriptional regulator [Streptomyces paludis]AXG77513.1 AfsR family transcriptional regulator [Streptomyces paludis]
MRVSVLGTTRAFHADGAPAALGGSRLRALLTVLALRPGRTVPVGVLVDEVWAADPPADAVGALQALVGRLRRTIGAAAVASDDGGYRLCVGAEDIDIHRFGTLLDEGARCLAQGDAVKAAGLLDDALALWRGPALADLPDRTAEAARWETRRLDARRTRLTAALALGEAEKALPELVELCGRFPLDERLQALRIRALRDAARPAEALAAYDEVRRALAGRLGTDPGPELRSLHGELLRGAGSINGSTLNGNSLNGSGTDDRMLPAHSPLSAAVPAPVPAPSGNLRARLTSFVGRESDMEAIRGDLGRARLVTLLGPGGAGKTRLSQEAAETVAEQWPDGVWLAELAPVKDAEAVAEAVLTALGARETVLRGAGAEELRVVDRHATDSLVRLVEHCARRRMLLLLDNCEHVIEAAAALAHELLAHCPELTVLATSREPLGVPGEIVRPVGPLPPDPAHRLFAERARTVRPDFDPAGETEAVAEICRRLDGLPLAIELAAARLRMLTPRRIADRLDDRFRLLTSGSRTVLPRQQTLRAVVDWSWELLDAPERAVLRRLSVFTGGCGLTAAEEVCADAEGAHSGDEGAHGGVASHDVAEHLGSLIDKSLVVAAPTPDGADMRYRLLETVAEYAAERLDEAGERAATERRHLVHYRELARTTDPELRGAGQHAAIARFRLEYGNLRTALRRAVALRDEQETLCLVLSLAWYWQMLDLRSDARQWSGVAAGLGPDPFAAPVQPAPPIMERCTDTPPPMTAEMLMEARREVRLVELASIDHEMDAWTKPEGLARLRTVADAYRPGLPQTCRFPGMLWYFAIMFTGDADELRRAMDETVRACEDFGFEWELAGSLHVRANVLANRSVWAREASRDADRSLVIYRRLGDSWGAAEALSARGEAREKAGEHALAAEDYAAAVVLAQELGARSQVALLRARLAATMFETGRGEEGERMLREVVAEYREGVHHAVPAARLLLAMWLGSTGRQDEAREHLAEAYELFSADTIDIFLGFVHGMYAWLDCSQGRYAEGLALARQAQIAAVLPLARMVAPEMSALHLLTAAWALGGLATDALSTHSSSSPRAAGDGLLADGLPADPARTAAVLIGAYGTLLPERHFRTFVERITLREARRTVAPLLDPSVYEEALAEGERLTLEAAVALVVPDAFPEAPGRPETPETPEAPRW